MIEIGVFTKTFVRPTLDGVLDAIAGQGLAVVQFTLASAGLPNLPETLAPPQIVAIRQAFAQHNLRMAALSGTFNMVHPDPRERRLGLHRLQGLVAACAGLDTQVVTLSTGTRDPLDLWRAHPHNQAPDAWADLLESMEAAVAIAEPAGVTLAFEPEISNVVDSAQRARRLLDEIRSPHLKVLIDGANLFHAGELPQMERILHEAFELLGDDIVLAHAKDLTHDGEAGQVAAGRGQLDYDLYLQLLHASGYHGALPLHSLGEDEVSASVAFLRATLQRARSRARE